MEDLKIPGRKRKTTRREDRTMIRKSMSDYHKTAPEIKAEMQLEHGVSVEAELIGRKPRKKPCLTSRHTEKSRLEFARTHKDWTVEQWSQVIGLHSHLISIQSKIFGTRLRQWPRNKIQQVLKNCGQL